MANNQRIIQDIPTKSSNDSISVYYADMENIIPKISNIVDYGINNKFYYAISIDAKEANQGKTWNSFLQYLARKENYRLLPGADLFRSVLSQIERKAVKTSMHCAVLAVYNVHYVDDVFIEKLQRISKNLLWEYKIESRIIFVGSDKQYARMLSKVTKYNDTNFVVKKKE